MESVSESKFKGSSGRYRPCTGARTFSSSSDERITTEFYINSSIKRKNRQKQPVQSHRRGRLRSKFHLSPVPDPIWVNLCEKWGESDIFVKFFKSEKSSQKFYGAYLGRLLAGRGGGSSSSELRMMQESSAGAASIWAVFFAKLGAPGSSSSESSRVTPEKMFNSW